MKKSKLIKRLYLLILIISMLYIISLVLLFLFDEGGCTDGFFGALDCNSNAYAMIGFFSIPFLIISIISFSEKNALLSKYGAIYLLVISALVIIIDESDFLRFIAFLIILMCIVIIQISKRIIKYENNKKYRK